MNLNFIKMEALSNDYIYIDMIENRNVNVADIRAWAPMLSDRHKGIGGDGVITLDATNASNGEISTRIFNSDGTEAEMCGNGLRCIAQLAYDRVYTKGKNEFDILLKKTSRKVRAFVEGDSVTINMGPAIMEREGSVEFNGEKIAYTAINIGNPHAVIFTKNIESINIEELGSFIENHEHFPQRTNVEFVNIIDKDNINMRVWERGAGETMACGSGACASVAVAINKSLCNDRVNVNMPGGMATVSRKGESMYLTGPVNYVFKGEYLIRIQ
ncbi:MAG: diaminopimelate epimerase [bacterium]